MDHGLHDAAKVVVGGFKVLGERTTALEARVASLAIWVGVLSGANALAALALWVTR